MNVTTAWVKQQAVKAKAPVVEGWKDGVLVVFVPGTPKNPLNGSHAHWSKRAKWAKGWREKAAARVYEIGCHRDGAPRMAPTPWAATDPKHVTFTVYGRARFDDDNLRAVCKPVRDALKDMAVIDDDRPSSGHVFEYTQAKPARSAGAIHGIAIRVELA